MTKKKLFSLMLTALIGVLAACNKDNEEDSNDVYYVKYEQCVETQPRYRNPNYERTITYRDVGKDCTITTKNASWEKTCGPFRKGDSLYIRCYPGRGTISVSRNNEPFVEKINGATYKATYIIDGEAVPWNGLEYVIK